MSDWKIEGLKSAAETTKQIVTLSTGVVTLTVTLLDKIVPHGTGGGAIIVPASLAWAWVLFGFSLAFGLFTMMAIAGTLETIDEFTNGVTTTKPVGIYGSNIRIPALLMIITFFAGMTLTIATGFVLSR